MVNLSEIPEKYISSTVEEFENTPEIVNGIIKCTETIIEDSIQGHNYILYSKSTGTGKTYAACVLLNSAIHKAPTIIRISGDREIRYFDFETPVAMFVSYVDLMAELKRKDRDELWVNKVKNAKLLLLDDMTITPTLEYQQDLLYTIINYRYNNKLSNIITMNINLQCEEQRQSMIDTIGRRNFSRLMENRHILNFNNSPARRNNSEIKF
jgi:DNA replication protein DnaC